MFDKSFPHFYQNYQGRHQQYEFPKTKSFLKIKFLKQFIYKNIVRKWANLMIMVRHTKKYWTYYLGLIAKTEIKIVNGLYCSCGECVTNYLGPAGEIKTFFRPINNWSENSVKLKIVWPAVQCKVAASFLL